MKIGIATLKIWTKLKVPSGTATKQQLGLVFYPPPQQLMLRERKNLFYFFEKDTVFTPDNAPSLIISCFHAT
jgi:hypothetical protein